MFVYSHWTHQDPRDLIDLTSQDQGARKADEQCERGTASAAFVGVKIEIRPRLNAKPENQRCYQPGQRNTNEEQGHQRCFIRT